VRGGHASIGAAMILSDHILFIDAEALVLNKPAGLPVDAPRRGGDSIAARIEELKCGFQRPPTAMHRLDTDTSGCLLFARTARGRATFQQAFETRTVEKYYLAVIGSELTEEQGMIDVPLAKTSSERAGWRMVADDHGLEATTRWRRIAIREGTTLVEFRPLTGRTHQIRAHAREAPDAVRPALDLRPGVGPDLLFQDRGQHDRADPGRGQLADPGECAGQRRRRRHERGAQPKPQVAGGEVDRSRSVVGLLHGGRMPLGGPRCNRRMARGGVAGFPQSSVPVSTPTAMAPHCREGRPESPAGTRPASRP